MKRRDTSTGRKGEAPAPTARPVVFFEFDLANMSGDPAAATAGAYPPSAPPSAHGTQRGASPGKNRAGAASGVGVADAAGTAIPGAASSTPICRLEFVLTAGDVCPKAVESFRLLSCGQPVPVMALNEKGQAAKGQRSVSYRHCRAVRVTRDFLQFGDTTPAADGRGQDTVVVAATATQPATGTLLGVAAQDKNAPPALSVGGGSLAPANATGNPVVLAVAAASCPSALAAAPLPLGAESAATQAAVAQAAASTSVVTASAPGASRAGTRPGIAPGVLPGAQSGTPYATFEHEATGAVRHAFGVVSLASSGPNSAGSQFCIVVGADPDAVASDAGGAAEYAVAASALADLDRRHVSIGALVDSAENRAALRKLRDTCAEVAAAAAASTASLHHQRGESETADGDLEESSGHLDRPLFATHAYDEMLFSGAGPDITPATASVVDVRIPSVAHGCNQQVVIRDCGIVASA